MSDMQSHLSPINNHHLSLRLIQVLMVTCITPTKEHTFHYFSQALGRTKILLVCPPFSLARCCLGKNPTFYDISFATIDKGEGHH